MMERVIIGLVEWDSCVLDKDILVIVLYDG